MVTDAVLEIFASFLGWMVGLLPEWSLAFPSILTDAIAGGLAYDDMFPISECLIVASAQATLVGGMTLFRWGKQIADWVADVIP